jgi:penicillin-binding protein 2
VRYRPRLVQRVESPDGTTIRDFEPEKIGDLPLRPTVLAQVREGLEGVVNAPGGTGRRAALPEVRVAGKTGTSQVVTLGRTRLKAHQVPWQQRDHAWFVAYAPAQDPEVAVAALVEHADGGGGAVAAPIVNQVLQAFFRLEEEKEPARYAQN